MRKIVVVMGLLLLLSACTPSAPVDEPVTPVEPTTPPVADEIVEDPAVDAPTDEVVDEPSDEVVDEPADEVVDEESDEAADEIVAEPALPEQNFDHGWLFPLGERCSFDLDGDGTMEELAFLIAESGAPSLTVNGQDLSGALNQSMDLPAPTYVILNIDPTDHYLELGIQDDGPSNDPHTDLYRYEAGTLTQLGSINGYFDPTLADFRGAAVCNGDGTIRSFQRFGVLQTWFGTAQFTLQDGAVTMIPQEFYTRTDPEQPQLTAEQEAAIADGTAFPPYLELLMDVNAYAAPDQTGEAVTLPAGTRLWPMGASEFGDFADEDRSAWVCFKLWDSDEEYYVYFSSWFDCTAADGQTYDSWDIFANCTMYD